MHDLRYDAHAPDERTQYDMPTVKPPPAQAFAQLRQTFGAAADAIDNPNGRYSTPARIDPADLRTVPAPDLRAPYGVPTSTDRIDYLTQQVDFLREQQAAIAQKLRWISEQLALLAGDVPFAGRIAEDECGHA